MMFNNTKVDKLFEDLSSRTKNCQDIIQFNKISSPVVQEVIHIYQKEGENNTKTPADIICEIIDRLTLCMPEGIPYVPRPIYVEETNQCIIGFARKDAKLTMVDNTILKPC